MLGTYFIGLVIVAAGGGILALCKLRIFAMLVMVGYNLFWFGAVFSSGNGFAFGYEPEEIKTLDGYVLIMFTVSIILIVGIMAAVDEIHMRRKIPKEIKKPTRPTPRKGK